MKTDSDLRHIVSVSSVVSQQWRQLHRDNGQQWCVTPAAGGVISEFEYLRAGTLRNTSAARV